MNFITNRKIKKTIKEKFNNVMVELTMADGTTKTVNGKEWLSMDSRLIKHFKMIN